ncbi:hypothetical protein B0H63DRAFT_478129 [Podospora didyma]|uniref:Uncharacterized protein n=1 Tax=Podospora didyma TaxID=330526 RepID=A0AAE0KKZ5_9PEZI|nr:hypothetical protein B0H63DRAFT_478129 [Podospora didyma]
MGILHKIPRQARHPSPTSKLSHLPTGFVMGVLKAAALRMLVSLIIPRTVSPSWTGQAICACSLILYNATLYVFHPATPPQVT